MYPLAPKYGNLKINTGDTNSLKPSTFIFTEINIIDVAQ